LDFHLDAAQLVAKKVDLMAALLVAKMADGLAAIKEILSAGLMAAFWAYM